MKRLIKRMAVTVGLAFMLTACVTVNIYFPAAKVEATAEEIVDDVYGVENPTKAPKPSSSLGRFLAWIGPREAHAQDAATVSNATIRAIKGRLAGRHGRLVPHYQAGRIGIDNQGFIQIKDVGGMPLNQLAALKREVQADNNDRNQLYQEVANALKLKSSHVGQIKSIFARQWRDKAQAGWWIQDDNGQWRRK